MSSTADTQRSTGPDGAPAASTPLDHDTFALLFGEHRAALRRFVVSKTGDRQHAEDVVQEVFAKAFANRSRFDPTRPFWPWLVSIAARECIDIHRHRSYAERRLSTFQQRTGAQLAPDPAVELARAVDHRRLRRQLDSLPVRQRVALELVAMDEWSYAEVAEHMGNSVATVKSLVLRARRTLRKRGARAWGGLAGGVRALRRRVGLTANRPLPLSWLPRPDELAAAWGSGALSQVSAVVATALVALTASPGPSPQLPIAGSSFAVAGAGTVARADRGRPEGRSVASASTRPPTAAVERIADEAVASAVSDHGTARPENVVVSTFAVSPGYDDDHTVFVVGSTGIDAPAPVAPLLVTRDGGASWERLRAVGLASVRRLLLPPSYPADARIFAFTGKGLQVSHDGGQSFETPATFPYVGANEAVDLPSSATFSPDFEAGDPSVLFVAGGRLWRYRVDSGAVDIVELGPALAGHVVTGVGHADGAVMVGTVLLRAAGAAERVKAHHMSRCRLRAVGLGMASAADCETVRLEVFAEGSYPPVRTGLSSTSPVVYVPFSGRLFASRDGGRTFGAVQPWPETLRVWKPLQDVAEIPGTGGRSAVAGLSHPPTRDGTRVVLTRTDDDGATWRPLAVDVPRFLGVSRVAATPSGRIIAASSSAGIACSEDGGRTWARLCPTPDTA